MRKTRNVEGIMSKVLNIVIDPGFDGGKIVINKKVFHVPFICQDIEDEKDDYQYRRRGEDYISCIYEGRNYVVGKMARTLLLTKAKRDGRREAMDEFYNINRFNTKLFEVCMKAQLCYAIQRYAEITAASKKLEKLDLDKLSEYTINLGVALPHEYENEYRDSVTELFTKNVVLTLNVGSCKPIDFDFKVSEVFSNSQAKCALLNAILDENGDDNEDVEIYDYLPVLVIDAGYKTIGDFELARDESINKGESNTEYAMKNINDKVAEEIRKYKPDVYGYMIEEFYEKKEILHYLDEDKKAQDLDVVAIKDRIVKETCDKFMEHLLKRYEELLDIKMIVVAGGTGEVYYPYLKEYFEKERPHLKGKIILSESKMDGEEYGAVFAVALGMYKCLLMELGE